MSAAQLGNGTLVFVPGILGSELRLNKLGSDGRQRSDLVWGGELGVVWKTLMRHPDLLSAQGLEVGNVIREMRFPLFTLKIYGPLLDFCCAPNGLNLILGANLRAFPYDWRRDLRSIASDLGTFIQSLRPPVYVVAHSMGGLVTRLMLNMKIPGSSAVQGVFQIASPVAGSLKAYITLRKHPDFGRIGEGLMMLTAKSQWTSAQLMNSIGNMESIYQLLPPKDRKILMHVDGAMTSAVDLKIWDKRDHAFITAAMSVHKLLCRPLSVRLKCVYSTQIKTDSLATLTHTYRLDQVCGQAEGDGTVTTESAIAASNDPFPCPGKDAEHTKMCTLSDLHAELKKFLN